MDQTSTWISFVSAQGAHFDASGTVGDFGDAHAELRASLEAAALVPLTHLGLIRVSGADARDFLNSQFTSDVRQVSPGAAQYSGYCTPKGRLLATFLVFLRAGDYFLLLPRELAEPIVSRLRRYVLRLKVTLRDESDAHALLGVVGPHGAEVVARGIGQPPRHAMEVVQYDATTVVALPGSRQLVVADVAEAPALWDRLRVNATPAGAGPWQLQQVRAGIVSVSAATQEAFVPQMLNLETYGAVSFQKGCYPGQEIVARTHYLGDLKRRLYFGRSARKMQPGDEIIAGGEGGEPAGTVAEVAPTPDGDWEFLAVLHRDAVQSAEGLRTPSGQPVEFERQPFSVGDKASA